MHRLLYLSLKNVFEIAYVIALDRIRLGTGRRFDILLSAKEADARSALGVKLRLMSTTLMIYRYTECLKMRENYVSIWGWTIK